MKNKLKNLFNLSKLFIRENDTNLKIFENGKINKRSWLFWIYIILAFGSLYASVEIVRYVVGIGKPEIFLNGFLLLLQILIIVRTIMVSMNVFYFSKDIENVLHLPFSSTEILISKFNTVLFMNYEMEALFGLIPLFVYGINVNMGLGYFSNLIFVLAIFPIFASLAVSILMIFLMKTIKLFKNKDLMQIIISFALIFIVMTLAGKVLEYTFTNMEYITENQQLVLNNINDKLIEANSYFLSINPIKNILEQEKVAEILLEYIKLIGINLIAIGIFVFLGNRWYLKQLLNAKFYTKKKKTKEINLKRKLKKRATFISYTKKEFKMLLKNPMFFIQSIYPVVIMTVVACIVLSILVPKYMEILSTEEYKEKLEGMKFNIEAVCIIIGVTQVVGLMNYSSVTAFSRDGKNAYIAKYIPISLYKQIVYKNIPQIVINTICSGCILAAIKLEIPAIGLGYIFTMFGLSFLMTLINSFILTVIDLNMPKLEWDAEYEILKNNKNKLLQYSLIVFSILFLVFINKLFDKHNLDISLGIFAIILLIIFVIINYIIFKFKDKLYRKIG